MPTMHLLLHRSTPKLRLLTPLIRQILRTNAGASNSSKYERKTPHEHVLLRPGIATI